MAVNQNYIYRWYTWGVSACLLTHVDLLQILLKHICISLVGGWKHLRLSRGDCENICWAKRSGIHHTLWMIKYDSDELLVSVVTLCKVIREIADKSCNWGISAVAHMIWGKIWNWRSSFKRDMRDISWRKNLTEFVTDLMMSISKPSKLRAYLTYNHVSLDMHLYHALCTCTLLCCSCICAIVKDVAVVLAFPLVQHFLLRSLWGTWEEGTISRSSSRDWNHKV